MKNQYKCSNSINIDNKILYICSKEYEFFLKKLNVSGIGLGFKVKKGVYTNEKCIKVFVSKKIPTRELSEESLVPAMYKGIKTDIVESGKFEMSSLTKRIRPVPGGYSIGPCTIFSAGTMGCLVKGSGNHIYILSNEHILAVDGSVPLQIPILQPAPPDGGIVYRDTVGNLTKYIPIQYITPKKAPENYVDCAMAEVKDKSMVTSKIALIGQIKGVGKAKVKQTVEKVGATTEHTDGEVISIGTTITEEFPKGKAVFKDQIITTYMSQGGDSGSVLLNLNSEVVGLLWGQSQSHSICNNISNVLKSLNVSILK